MTIIKQEGEMYRILISQQELNDLYDACNTVTNQDNDDLLLGGALTSLGCANHAHHLEPFQTLTEKEDNNG